MLDGFVGRFVGTVAFALQEKVAEGIDHLVHQLLETSVVMWKRDNWLTYNAEEGNCTVQLYKWCRHTCRNDRRFALLTLHLEWVNVTPAMLAGSESVKSAGRPDLRIDVGKVGRAIECKRLAPTGGWPRAYVYDGLARFVVGDYGSNETIGYMVGYVQAGTFAELLASINHHISVHPQMGPGQELKPLRGDETYWWSRSAHSRLIRPPID